MKIGIDARLIEETGVGRYIRNLVTQLGSIDAENQYVIFLSKKSFDSFVCPNGRWQKKLADVPWHSLREQLVMPGIFGREKLDLLHVPYFNVPLFYSGKFIPTIHDLIILSHATGKATTLPSWAYQMRRLGYRIVLYNAIKRAAHILTVSETVKKKIVEQFSLSANKVTVTYEGVDIAFESRTSNLKPPIPGPYFLYVGNAYPHKNVETIIQAFNHSDVQDKLVLVGKEDFFYKKLKMDASSLARNKDILFLQDVSDEKLGSLYAHARALLVPSFDEGFGLPPLEALVVGTRVIVSDIPIFHEILGELPTFVDPHDMQGWHIAIEEAAAAKKSTDFPKKAKAWVTRYSWKTLAEQTRALYASL